MQYKIKGDSTLIIFETKDQQRKPRREQDDFGGETIICDPEGRCRVVIWPLKGTINR